MKGIDISVHQSQPLNSYAEKYFQESDFVIVKATQGTSYKSTGFFKYAIEKALKANKLCGAYHYADGTGAIAQADYFISIVKPYIGKIILCLDWETSKSAAGKNYSWGSTTYAKQFMDRVYEKTGIRCFLYTGMEGINHCKNCYPTYKLWFAGYPNLAESWTPPIFPSRYSTSPWPKYDIWQYTNSNGKLDRNTTNLTKSEWNNLIKKTSSVIQTKNTTKEVVRMNSQNMKVLINAIGAVESGGQIYGQRRYNAYAAPYTNSNVEHTITLGWAQNYGYEAKRLIQMIYDKSPSAFKKIDTSGTIQSMLSKDWVAIRWNPSSAQKNILIQLIDSKIGHQCQDDLFAQLMNKFIAECESTYTKNIKAVMMYCEIRHLGGKGPVDRIFKRCNGNYSLDNIMASLKQDQNDTSNNNQVGDAKFQSRHNKCKEFIEKYAITETSTSKEGESKVSVNFNNYYNLISNSGGDEYGGIHGGTAGDQTGGEWNIRSWYSRPWQCVLRHPDKNVRELIAELAIEAANNNKIGYDQYQRDTYWQQLQRVGYRPSKITTPCEADCSAGVIANTRAAGYLLNLPALKNVSASYTGNMRAGFKAAGFQVLTDSKYLTSSAYLVPGDILLNDGAHTATNLGIGSKSGYSGSGNSAGIPDSGLGKNITTTSTKDIQTYLNEAGWSLTVDGSFGPATTKAVKEFQTLYKIEVDGIVGNTTLGILKAIHKIVKDGFNAKIYSDNYADLKKVFGTDKKKLLQHYYEYGQKEKRNAKTALKTTTTKPATTPTKVTSIPVNTSGTYSKTKKATGQITALLNIRKGPGTNYSNLVSYPTLKSGTKVDVCDAVKNHSTGVVWYYIRISGSKGDKYGFASSQYIKLV